MTTKLYEKDSYIKQFTANVLSSDEQGTVLDQTAFFPEGGGQYGDTGFINGIRVTDTQIKNGIIYHITQDTVELGTAECSIDWDVRYNRMQNHSGEHILSGVISNNYGYNNVGFHLSDNEVTLDVDGKFTDDDIEFLEAETNKIIDLNTPVTIYYPTPDELEKLDYRSKLDLTENVRIVRVEGVDQCACCAPHVRTSAEVGLVKIIKHYNYKGGTRLHIMCGAMARRDYALLSRMNNYVTNARSAKRYELSGVFDHLEAELSEVKVQFVSFKNSVIIDKVASTLPQNGVFLYFADGFGMEDLIRMTDTAIHAYPDALACSFDGNDTDGYNFSIGGNNAKERFADFKSSFNVRGGGRDMFQGKVTATKKELQGFFTGL